MAGVYDWSEEGIEEDEDPGLLRRGRSARTPSSSPDHDEPIRISSSSRSLSSPGLRRPFGSSGSGSGSPSSPPGLGSSRSFGDRPAPRSMRTRRSPRAPSVRLAAAGDAGSRDDAGASTGGSYDDEDPDDLEETVSWMRDRSARPRLTPPPDTTATSASITAGRAEEEAERDQFSFPPIDAPPSVVDAADVLGQFAAQFLEATMGATAGPRTAEIKKELLLGRRVVDVAGLERWLRKVEALAELAWFTDLCSDEESEAPPLELFECAFRALEGASSDELHRAGADARRFWIGPVAVLEFFLCPLSKKVMEDPVVVTSGKTVDRSELEKWWNKHKRICPVTGEVLNHSIFIPDVLIARCISRWRAANRISDLTASTDPPAISPEDEALFKEATVLAHSPSNSKEDYEAILRLLEQCSFLHLLGRSPGTISKLACVLPETCLEPYPELDNIILEIFAKAASYSPNKEVLGDDRYTIPVLIARALLGPVPTRAKCAQILGLLADNYYNKIKIGELGGFAPLMELLLVGDIGVKRTVATALASLCEAQENWSRFVREGVADAAISLMRNDNLVDEAHSIFLQAEGFDVAMTEIMEKLASFDGEEMCEEMTDRLWDTFIRSTPGQRRRPANFAPEAPEASSSSSSAVSMDDVQAIVSWLQNRSYNPRTYRYGDLKSRKEATG
ncbi:hypothetical protein QYE76_043508 [Lolium multiflorum]|uniref:RING-type E3 ubiquitin transferase n=1 Tax=Lolium multiflorum TaxID=4521 RepID=A0AAD8THC5_LOLMU|nr:hypothetical protein QYE76_043508 [Lolium multiflorum]